MEIPVLIKDLAVMMLTAGIITIVFKKIKQPLILGYILAGFLLSPYFPWFANILDTESISTWSEIGIIFLMFHLGLEFNLHKMADVGGSAIITCLIETIGMLAAGYLTGHALGFSPMDSICLGAMLVMSSTTIIIKVFGELKITAKYTETVFGILVVEDIVGIFMMVILSTVGVSQSISGAAVLGKLGLMLLYLVIWLILGIYIIPTFINKTVKYMTDEMLLVISIGICFGMVLLADKLGFSSALGAFLSGSLIAGTVHAKRVESLTNGVKDMFGAVFFVSVGMMANPQMIAKYWLQILIIIVVTLLGKLVFNTLGMMLSGQRLDSAIETGFSLAQIGEFAFIIANLGYSIGLIDQFLYPIVVAVSVITTFTTPFCIKLAPKCVTWLEKVLPEKLIKKLDKYTSSEDISSAKDSDWGQYIKKYFLKTIIYGGIMFIAMTVMVRYAEPLLENIGLVSWLAKLISIVIIYLVMAIFIAPLLDRSNNLFSTLWLRKLTNRMPLLALSIVKILLVAVIAVIPLRVFFKLPVFLLAIILIAGLAGLITLSTSGIMATWYLKMETHFLKNYNEVLIEKEESEGNKQEWLDEKLYITSFYVPEKVDYLSQSLKELNWAAKYNVYIVKLTRGEKAIVLPDISVSLNEGDKVYIVGEKEAIENFFTRKQIHMSKPVRTIKEFMSDGYDNANTALSVVAVKVYGDEEFVGKPIRQGQLKRYYNCMVIGIQKGGYPIVMPDPNRIVEKDDIIWILGSNANVGSLVFRGRAYEGEVMTKDYKKLQNGSDIRGVALPGVENEPVNLDEEAAKRLTVGFIRWLNEKTGKQPDSMTVSVGHDSRLSADALKNSLIEAMQMIGVKVLDCSLASTPSMFMSTVFEDYDCDGAIMITASHLPFNRNGFKYFSKDGGLEKKDISKIVEYAGANDIFKTFAVCEVKHKEERDLIGRYSEYLREKIKQEVNAEDYEHPLAGLKITVDCGNGAGGFYESRILAPLGANTEGSIFLDPDGSFPNHEPNPENKKAMQAISEAVIKNEADLGLIFDTDVDRASAVDKNGKEISRNAIVAMAAALIADEYPGTTVVTDSITSDELTVFLEDLGLKHLRFKRGYRNVINRSIELNEEGVDSQLAIETSGHAAYKENFFLDDGAYLAAKIVIRAAIMKREGKTIDSLVAALKEPKEAREVRIPLKAQDFQSYGDDVLDGLKKWAAERADSGITIVEPNYEGIRLKFDSDEIKGWCLLRKSLHDPIMPLNIETTVGSVDDILDMLGGFFAKYGELEFTK